MGAQELAGVDIAANQGLEGMARNFAALGYSSAGLSFTCGDVQDMTLPPFKENYYTCIVSDPPYGVL